MENRNEYDKEIIKRLDSIIEQNNTIIAQDTFRAKHIATIKRDLRIIETIIALEVILAFFAYFMFMGM